MAGIVRLRIQKLRLGGIHRYHPSTAAWVAQGLCNAEEPWQLFNGASTYGSRVTFGGARPATVPEMYPMLVSGYMVVRAKIGYASRQSTRRGTLHMHANRMFQAGAIQ
jgi:hypothetical protein